MFYLDDTKIKQPAGWAGAYWERKRNPAYFGIWRHQTAMVKGVGEVAFEGRGRELLKALFAKYGPNAQCLFYVEDGGQRGYQSEIDFAMWSDDGRFFNANFRDEQGVELDALSGLMVGLTPQIEIELPQQPLSAGIEYEIDPGQRGAFRAGDVYALPLKTTQNGEGSGLSVVSPFRLESIYHNNTSRTTRVELSGKLVGTFSGTGTLTAKVQITADGTVRDEVTLDILTASGTEQSAILSHVVAVPPGAYLRIVAAPSDSLTVVHSGDSFLTLYENAESADSYVWGLTFKQAFETLLQNLTNGKVTLVSNYLTKGDGASRLLTSEPNLRGYKRDVQISFKQLWEDADRMDNLAAWRRGDTLYIETKADMIRAVGRTAVDTYTKLVHGPSDFFVSKIQGGFDLWSSGSAAGREEFCSLRGYQTEQQKVKESADLTCRNLSASGRLMEVLRRNPQGQSADSGYEEKLFVIVGDRTGATYRARTGGVSGVSKPDTVINADISPRRNMNRWMNVYGINGTLSLTSGQANTAAVVQGISESKALAPTTQLFTGRMVMMDTSMTMRQYSALGEVIEYIDHDGQQRAFLVTEDNYRFGTGGAFLKGYELNE